MTAVYEVCREIPSVWMSNGGLCPGGEVMNEGLVLYPANDRYVSEFCQQLCTSHLPFKRRHFVHGQSQA
jgi:hypothetical protein